MQAQSDQPVKTFTIGFDQPGYNEATQAQAVSAHLGTDHRERILTADETMAVIPQLPEIYDEPFADSSQIPTYLVSRMAREHVTVALSGDGGDEIFTGYNRYIEAAGRLHSIWAMPGLARWAMARGIETIPTSLWPRILPDLPQPGAKMSKLAGAISVGQEGFYKHIVSTWQNPGDAISGACEIW